MSSTAQRGEYDTHEAPRPVRAGHPERGPGFWRAPFSGAHVRELGFTLGGLPLAVAGFVYVVTLFALGAGTLVTVIGLPVLAALLGGARGFGAAERARARRLLALDVRGPAPVVPARPGFWAGATARLADPAGWKAVLYQVLMFPWAIVTFVLSLTFQVTGWVVAAYPLYHWVFARWTPWPGYQVFDFTKDGERHRYFVESPVQIAAMSAIGFALVLLTPQLVRALTHVNRLAIRGLLGGGGKTVGY
ncbi:sensor domain-containing protein [Kitasatospora sp. NPDC057015]|uniref:sensor domain-containing protein n=1 Tax=Kitasatospora sp. NPDC057015 TaxID=3346001 RepID=UPI003636C905